MYDSFVDRLSPETGAFDECTREEWDFLPWKRYQYFYGVLVPVIIHDALFRLHTIPLTRNLCKVVSAQALVTGLFDDLFDRLYLPSDRILALMETPDQILASYNIEEFLCQYLFREIHKHFNGDQQLFEESVRAIMSAQEMSIQQASPDLPLNDILKITRKKGAKAVLFYRSCIDHPLTDVENGFLTELGALFQMTNDINDALIDCQSNERTMMTIGLTLREICEIFDAQISQTIESCKLLSNDQYHKKGFFSRINILVARSLVTLDRYGRLVDPETPFDIGNVPKNKVISGFRIPHEVRRWFRHYTSMEDY